VLSVRDLLVKVETNSLYHRHKRSSNKIRILQTKFEFGKKTNLTSLMLADIQQLVYPEEVTRLLHVMAQARESLSVTVLRHQQGYFHSNPHYCGITAVIVPIALVLLHISLPPLQITAVLPLSPLSYRSLLCLMMLQSLSV